MTDLVLVQRKDMLQLTVIVNKEDIEEFKEISANAGFDEDDFNYINITHKELTVLVKFNLVEFYKD